VVDASGRAYFTAEPLLGSISVKGGSSKEGDWKLVERTFQAGESKGLQRIHIDMRTASLKFDNKVDGTLWIDQVSIRPVGK
jgi:hypothetical protein